jgi:hypothetical protein
MADLLVAAGEQEDFYSFFAPQNREQRLTFRLFHRPTKVAFWDMVLSPKGRFMGGPSGRPEGRFPPARLLLPGGRAGLKT